jgi:hypothetical protein
MTMKSVLASMCWGVAGYWAVAASVASAGYIEVLNTVAGADKVSYWNLQETDGAAADAWTTGTLDGANDGTFSGTGYTRGVAGPRPSDGFLGFSASNKAVNFTGTTSQLLQMADSASFAGKQSLTLLMFCNIPTGTTGNDRVMGGLYDKTVGGSSRYGFLLNSRLPTGTAMRGGVRVWDGAAESGGLFDAVGFGGRDSTWHFVALTMNDQGADKLVSIYFDGALKFSNIIANGATLGLAPRHTSAANGVLTFGTDLGDTNRFLVGSLDEIAFIGRALTGEEVTGLWNAARSSHPGDFDGDGDVDGADFVAWQTSFPLASGATLAQGDADGDGDVDGADFVVWQTNFPFTPAPGTAPVPEPGAVWLLLFGGIAIVGTAGRQRHQQLRCTVAI